MTDKELIRELLAFSEQLITEHRLGEALIVSVAAARLMELPERVEVLRHPSGKVADTTTVRPGTVVPFKKNSEDLSGLTNQELSARPLEADTRTFGEG